MRASPCHGRCPGPGVELEVEKRGVLAAPSAATYRSLRASSRRFAPPPLRSGPSGDVVLASDWVLNTAAPGRADGESLKRLALTRGRKPAFVRAGRRGHRRRAKRRALSGVGAKEGWRLTLRVEKTGSGVFSFRGQMGPSRAMTCALWTRRSQTRRRRQPCRKASRRWGSRYSWYPGRWRWAPQGARFIDQSNPGRR